MGEAFFWIICITLSVAIGLGAVAGLIFNEKK